VVGDEPAERLLTSLMLADEASALKIVPMLVQRGENSIMLDNGVTMVPASYYPDTAIASQAMVINVGPGETKTSLDFHVRRAHAYSVAGSVTGQSADPNTVGRVGLRLRPADPLASDSELGAAAAFADPGGRFAFLGVPPGEYVVDATTLSGSSGTSADGTIRADGPVLIASVSVTVSDASIGDLSLALHPSVRLTGRVEFAGTAQPPNAALTRISVTLEPVGTANAFAIPRGRVETDGTFSTSSVLRGRYLLRVSRLALPGAGSAGQPGASATWWPQSAIVNGRDALDQDIEIDQTDLSAVVITFSDKPGARLSGTVRDLKNTADAQATILVFPTDSRLWSDFSGASRRIRLARTSRIGYYAVSDLPAGEYYVAVGTDDDFLGREAPGALEALSRKATRVSLADGQPKSLDLRSGGR
jgi:hypothetical protein